MEFEEAYELAPGQGWLLEDEARLLWDAAKRCEGPILEVGCYYGRSTVLLACLGRTVYSVDPFDGFDSDKTGDQVAQGWAENIHACNIRNVTLFRQKIEDWPIHAVGFAYLDGDHTYEGSLSQIRVALDAGAPSFCIHDYAENGGGLNVKRAIEDTCGIRLMALASRMAYCEVLQ